MTFFVILRRVFLFLKCWRYSVGNSDGSLLSTWRKVFSLVNVGAFLARVALPPPGPSPSHCSKKGRSASANSDCPRCEWFHLPFYAGAAMSSWLIQRCADQKNVWLRARRFQVWIPGVPGTLLRGVCMLFPSTPTSSHSPLMEKKLL